MLIVPGGNDLGESALLGPAWAKHMALWAVEPHLCIRKIQEKPATCAGRIGLAPGILNKHSRRSWTTSGRAAILVPPSGGSCPDAIWEDVIGVPLYVPNSRRLPDYSHWVCAKNKPPLQRSFFLALKELLVFSTMMSITSAYLETTNIHVESSISFGCSCVVFFLSFRHLTASTAAQCIVYVAILVKDTEVTVFSFKSRTHTFSPSGEANVVN